MTGRGTRHSRFTALTVCIMALMPCAAAFAGAPTRSSETLTIVDLDGTTVTLTVDDFRRMPLEVEEEYVFVGEEAGFIGVFDFTGVRLGDLLQKAKAAQAASGYKQENLYLVFRGTDGYQVVASWNELTQSPDGRRAMVAVDKNEKPLPPSEGSFRVIFPADRYVGRSVKCLETIEIRVAEGFKDKKEH